MGVERRKGRLYWYDRRRVGGRVHTRYLGPLSPGAAARVRDRAESERAARRAERESTRAAESEAVAVLAAGEEFDREADWVFRAVMSAMGYHCHRRGEWRRKREGGPMTTLGVAANTPGARTPAPPLVRPAARRSEHQAILDRAARGDASVIPEVGKLLDDRAYLDALGGVAEMARNCLIAQAAGDDVAVMMAMAVKYREYLQRLLADGPEPSYAERLAATRAAHNWLAVHILECRASVQLASSPAAVAIERRVTQAERRLHASLRSLAVLRRLRKPSAVAQVNIAKGGGSVVVNNGAPGATR